MPHVMVDRKRCVGCHTCELACSAWQENVFRPTVSRLRVECVPLTAEITAFTCLQMACGKCREACPEGALVEEVVRVSVGGGIVEGPVLVVDKEKCSGCGLCIDVCPTRVIKLHPETGKAVKCDLCGGEPQCFYSCQNPLVRAVSVRVDRMDEELAPA